ncbi:hypothetical protein K1T71_001726 [Dendrolimus kikuchii]|uniref:Uncharacterized protein n=1 Tax=Dendrolimus kikuchii TaxID=765133 RepID=A0ACC1DEP7_9NEOP|nr:hypothetical protein K1T71_001726 [Dendrolimus kikuchii]
MNGLSFSELCCLFCCPPCPGKIAAKLAFLPPEPTYAFTPDETGSKFSLTLTERAEWQYSEREKENIEGFYSRTSRGNRIACLFVRCSPNARFTILFSHGNAVDLGQMSSFYLGLGTRINCNIFSYDYSGYGVSGGKPSEKNLYADIDAAWQALRTRYGISPENIILYGQSIGTVPTVDLAARYEVGAVVLHSPLMSGMRVAFPNTKRTWFFDAFPSIDKIPKVTSPVLVIHGTEDEVIDFSHGLAIYERCPRAVEPLWVEGAGQIPQGDDQNPASTLSSGTSTASPREPHHRSEGDADERDRGTLAHNISISVTDTDSPVGVRRRIHLRSLSDVTPTSRAQTPRARSHSERPRESPAPSPTPSPSPSPSRPPPLAVALFPRAVRSERSSPDASMVGLDGAGDTKARLRSRFGGDNGTALGDPWRKMSEADLNVAGGRSRISARAALDPWIKIPSVRSEAGRERSSRDESAAAASATVPEPEPRREGGSKRGKLERRSPVVCESCGNESCECWRVRSPGCPRTPRLQRAAASLGAQCTCEARSPRPSPQRLSPRAPARALSAEGARPRPRHLYKSVSQRALCPAGGGGGGGEAPAPAPPAPGAAPLAPAADPLLETTC